MQTNQARLTDMPGLDGIRALAILAVFLYHAGVAWLPGGFLGVESFFVISGFLITSLLLLDWSRHGRIDLKQFWARRALRLLPALWALLGVATTATALLAPQALPRTGEDALTAFLYITNWAYIYRQVPYFETFNQPVLQHLWSLAVEEQVYLVWPVLVIGLLRVTRGSTGWVLAVLALGAATSFTPPSAAAWTRPRPWSTPWPSGASCFRPSFCTSVATGCSTRSCSNKSSSYCSPAVHSGS